MTPEKIKTAIEKALGNPGAIFSITNRKKDGTIRKYACRFKVTKGLSPDPDLTKKRDPARHGCIVVWDTNARGYKWVKTNTILYLNAGRKVLIRNGKPTNEYDVILDS